MIRAVRFATKLDFEIEPATRAAIERHCGDLAKSSVPRLAEEIFRTLSFKGAERALFLMEQLGVLEVLLPKLSAHLRESADEGDPERTAIARNLAALGGAIEAGEEPSRPLILATVFADLHRTTVANAGEAHRLDLVEYLRERGFSRADTDHMRLLLEAATHMMTRSRLSRRLVRRPYYPEARRFFELIAPTYEVEVAAFDRFLAETRDHAPRARRSPSAIASGGGRSEPSAIAEATNGDGAEKPRKRRRRHRGGRHRRRIADGSPPTVLTDAAAAEIEGPANGVAATIESMPAGESIPAADGITEAAAIGTANGSAFPGPR
jgi:hypothetical protein